ncbi:MAG: hypothetical protein GY870_09500 [archaeon]|nr:hypothetical protein [archaeon]
MPTLQEQEVGREAGGKVRIFFLKLYASFIVSFKYTRKRSLKVDLILDRIDKIKDNS